MFNGRLKRAEPPAFRKPPAEGWLRLRLRLHSEDLLRRLAEKFRHGQMKLPGQSFNLLIERIRQWHFGFLHAAKLTQTSRPVQREEMTRAPLFRRRVPAIRPPKCPRLWSRRREQIRWNQECETESGGTGYQPGGREGSCSWNRRRQKSRRAFPIPRGPDGYSGLKTRWKPNAVN